MPNRHMFFHFLLCAVFLASLSVREAKAQAFSPPANTSGFIELIIYRDTTYWSLYIPDFDRSLYRFSIESLNFQVNSNQVLRTYHYRDFNNIADDNLVALASDDICITLYLEGTPILPNQCTAAQLHPRLPIAMVDRFWKNASGLDNNVTVSSGSITAFCTAGMTVCPILHPLTSLHPTPAPTEEAETPPPTPEPTATPSVIIGVVLADPLNLRDGPDEDFSIMGRLELGTVIQILGHNGEWFFVETSNGLQAWVAKRLVRQLPEIADIPFVDAPPPPLPQTTTTGKRPCRNNNGDAPLSYVSVNQRIRTVTTLSGDQGVAVFSSLNPLTRDPVSLTVGTVVTILAGPFCYSISDRDVRVMWRVRADTGQEGYIVEVEGDGFRPDVCVLNIRCP